MADYVYTVEYTRTDDRDREIPVCDTFGSHPSTRTLALRFPAGYRVARYWQTTIGGYEERPVTTAAGVRIGRITRTERAALHTGGSHGNETQG